MDQKDTPVAYPFPRPSLYHPSPVFDDLRADSPVVRISTPDGNHAWLVSRYDDVRKVLTDNRFSRAAAAGPGIPLAGLGRLARESMLGLDPPEHSRLRKLVSGAFTMRRVEELRSDVTKLVDQLLTEMGALPRPVDLVENFSLQLPVQVICELLGVPLDDRHHLHRWSDTVMGDWQQNPTELDVALAQLEDYFAEQIAAKRARPTEDLMSALIAARDQQDRLSERELVVLCLGLLIAGHEQTVSQISMSLLALLHHPDQFDRLHANPDLVPQAVEELLRFVQLSDGGGTLPRVTTEEVEIAGTVLPAGSVVMVATNSANRDESRFTESDRLDLTRTESRHIAFGAGVHHCLGAPLARMELQEALRGLLRHMPGVRVAVSDSDLQFKRGLFIRSLESLPVTW